MSDIAKPRLCVDLLLFDKEKVLLVQRGEEPFMGMWCVPGGLVMAGEMPLAAAARKARSECRVDAIGMRCVGVWSDIADDPRGWTADVVFEGTTADPAAATHGNTESDARWFAPNELPNEIVPGWREFLLGFIAGRNNAPRL